MISAPGVGSGLDVNSIINQLMAIESRPLLQIDSREGEYNAELSALGQVKGALSSFQDAMSGLADTAKFNVYSALSSDEDVLTASATNSAAPGSFAIQVTQLAQHHKMASNPFADEDTVVTAIAGAKATIEVDSDSFDVVIQDKTLAEIRDAINQAADNTGVTATIINEDLGTRLIVTANQTGTANAVSMSFTDGNDAPIADPLGMATIAGSEAQDAQLTVDGFNVTRSSNVIDDVIEGVTLNLHDEGSGPVTLNLARDNDAIVESVQAFVDAYNNLQNVLSDVGAGTLSGDGILLTIQSRILSEFNTPAGGVSSSFSYLSEVGVSIQKDGKLGLDNDKVSTALIDDFNGFAQLFADSNEGFAVRLESLAGAMIDDDGLLDVRTDSLNDRIDGLADDRDAVERRLDSTEQRLRAQFAALDSLLGQMQATSSFLTQQLFGLTG